MTSAQDATRRSLGPRRGTLRGAATALLLAATGGAIAAPRAGAAGASAGQALIVLLHDHVARVSPSPHAHRIEIVAGRRPLTGVRTVLPVLRATRRHGRTWVDVRLPGRPNGSDGWIQTGGTMPSWTPWRLSVALSARRVTVYYRGHVKFRFLAVVGAPSTPTPRGRFFIEEGLSLSPQASGAPFALASSARSNVLQEFDGGPGQVALHGTGNLAGALGTASSHGCIRLGASVITWLANHIGPGVPLNISG